MNEPARDKYGEPYSNPDRQKRKRLQEHGPVVPLVQVWLLEKGVLLVDFVRGGAGFLGVLPDLGEHEAP